MSTPRPNPDPLAPVTRVELHAELADVRETLARVDERLASIEKHGATKEFVLTTLRDELRMIRAESRTDRRWSIGTILAVGIALAGLILRGA